MKNQLLKYFIFTLFFASCNSQDLTINLKVENKSKIVFDSIKIYFYSTKDTTVRHVEPNKIINRKILLNNFSYPKGENLVTALLAFKDGYYYRGEDGIIGFPYSELQNKYNFYIYDDYITTREGFIPHFKREKLKISELKE